MCLVYVGDNLCSLTEHGVATVDPPLTVEVVCMYGAVAEGEYSVVPGTVASIVVCVCASNQDLAHAGLSVPRRIVRCTRTSPDGKQQF